MHVTDFNNEQDPSSLTYTFTCVRLCLHFADLCEEKNHERKSKCILSVWKFLPKPSAYTLSVGRVVSLPPFLYVTII